MQSFVARRALLLGGLVAAVAITPGCLTAYLWADHEWVRTTTREVGCDCVIERTAVAFGPGNGPRVAVQLTANPVSHAFGKRREAERLSVLLTPPGFGSPLSAFLPGSGVSTGDWSASSWDLYLREGVFDASLPVGAGRARLSLRGETPLRETGQIRSACVRRSQDALAGTSVPEGAAELETWRRKLATAGEAIGATACVPVSWVDEQGRPVERANSQSPGSVSPAPGMLFVLVRPGASCLYLTVPGALLDAASSFRLEARDEGLAWTLSEAWILHKAEAFPASAEFRLLERLSPGIARLRYDRVEQTSHVNLWGSAGRILLTPVTVALDAATFVVWIWFREEDADPCEDPLGVEIEWWEPPGYKPPAGFRPPQGYKLPDHP